MVEIFHTTRSCDARHGGTRDTVFTHAVDGCVVAARVWITGIGCTVDSVITCLVCGEIHASRGIRTGVDGTGVIVVAVEIQRDVHASENGITCVC